MRKSGGIEYEKEREMQGLQGAATSSSRMRKSKIYGRRGYDLHWLLVWFSCFWFFVYAEFKGGWGGYKQWGGTKNHLYVQDR